MRVRRIATVAAGTVTALALGMGSASAHFCYFNDPNPNANDGRAGSQGFFSFETITSQFLGLCPEGGQILADAGGVSMDTMINAHGLMAGRTGGNKAISHLDFGAILPAGPEAFAACGMDLPPDWFE